MTEERISRRSAEGIVREGDRAFAWCREYIAESGPVPCGVRHPDAGGKCEQPATMEVYGLPFCEVHGAEAKAGALGELYHDAAMVLRRLDNPSVPEPNAEAMRVLRAGVRELEAACREWEGRSDEAIGRAYPFVGERVEEGTLDFDYADPRRGPTPDTWFWDDRSLLHKLMRLAYEDHAGHIAEALELFREGASAQLAFAWADLERRRASGELPKRRSSKAAK